MKNLLTVTAVIEVGAGLALAGFPSAIAGILLGSWVEAPSTVTLARVTGAALLALGVACWLARDDVQGRAARGVVAAMLLYNIAVVAILTYGAAVMRLRAMGIWPALVVHAVMAVWCFACLRPGQRRT